MKTRLILLGIETVLLAACTTTQPVSPTPTPEPIVGGDQDEHGCIGSAGYTWCEAQKKCYRVWEEACDPATEASIKAALAVRLQKRTDEFALTNTQINDSYAKGGISFEPGAPGGLFLAARIDGQWKIVYHGNGSVDCAELARLAFPSAMMEGVCD